VRAPPPGFGITSSRIGRSRPSDGLLLSIPRTRSSPLPRDGREEIDVETLSIRVNRSEAIGRQGRDPSPAGIGGMVRSPPSADRRGRLLAAERPTYDWAMLDERDLDIVAALQDDARATYADVAGRVGLSASAVHDRVRKLERQGVIRGYSAVVDPEALGLFVTALIAASPLDPRQADDLPERVAEFPEVEDCYSVAGETNYVLKVRTRTTTDLEDLIRRLREKGNVATRTTIALSIPFERRPLHP